MPAPSTLQEAQGLLTQVGERFGGRVQTEEDEPGRWFVDLTGGGFLLEWVDQPARLVATGDLGHAPPQGELAALNLALSYNAVWQDAGAFRLGRDGDEGAFLLIADLDADPGMPEVFNAALLHFEAMRRWWVDALARAGDGPHDPPPPGMLLGRI